MLPPDLFGDGLYIDETTYLIEKILEAERTLGKSDVIINIESTGVYHLPLYSALSKIFQTNIYQPKQVKDRSSKNIRKSKTDKRDARTLSRIHPEITPPQTDYSDKEMYDVREIIRLRFKYKDLRTNLKKKFRRNLCVVFPNFDSLFKDRRIEYIDGEIKVYWDKIKNHLYFPTFPGIDMVKVVALRTEFGGLDRFSEPDKAVAFSGTENFVYISGDSKKFNGSMTKAGSSIIRRVCWEILSPPRKYIPKLTEHMNKTSYPL